MEIQKWLDGTVAKDVMIGDVVTLSPETSLAAAAATLLHEGITGAPVVDADNRCVGVLSIVDVLSADEKVAQERQKVAESSFFNSGLILPMNIYAEKLYEVRDKITEASEQPVEHFMTTNIVSVRESEPLAAIMQKMVDAHIHRVLVLGEQEQLMGIITTTDLLAGLLKARHAS